MNRNSVNKVNDFFKSELGSIIASMIVAFGIIAILRKSCTGPKCSVIKAPDPDMVARTTWKAGKKCFKFEPNPVDCPKKGVITR